MHSGDSAKASSALQLLKTIVPDQLPKSGLLLCPAALHAPIEKIASAIKKDSFVMQRDIEREEKTVANIDFKSVALYARQLHKATRLSKC